MCIKVESWFFCPQVKEQGCSEACAHGKTTDPPISYKNAWKHGDPVSTSEAKTLGLPMWEKCAYQRHREVTWIRCSINKGIYCEKAPHEVQTEIYSVPCHACNGLDCCLPRTSPLLSITSGHEDLEDGPELDLLKQAVKVYFDELIVLARVFVAATLEVPLNLDEELHRELFASLSCTRDIEHVVRDSPMAPYHFECVESCPCNKYPEAANFGRAFKQFDAKMVRDAYPVAWYTLSQKIDIDRLRYERGNFPEQQWLICNEAAIVDGESEAIAATLQAIHSDKAYPLETKKTRYLLAHALSFCPDYDPGLSQTFRKLLQAHLHTIVSHREADPAAPNVVRLLETILPPPGTDFDPRVEAQVEEAGESLKYLLYEVAQVRGQLLTEAMIRHGRINHWMVQRPTIGATHEAGVCAVCMEDMHTGGGLPPQLEARETPCCKQALHFGCFQGALRAKEACPLCRDACLERM